MHFSKVNYIGRKCDTVYVEQFEFFIYCVNAQVFCEAVKNSPSCKVALTIPGEDSGPVPALLKAPTETS